jgi:hypothetical protein
LRYLKFTQQIVGDVFKNIGFLLGGNKLTA